MTSISKHIKDEQNASPIGIPVLEIKRTAKDASSSRNKESQA